MTPLVLIQPDDPGDEKLAEREAAAEREQGEQIADAVRTVELPITEYLEWPWPRLARTMGGMAPGTLGFLCAASGAGKTSFLMSAARRWCSSGQRVYYAGFESRPKKLRTEWACRSLGIDAGDVLSGHAKKTWADWPARRRHLIAQLEMQDVDPIRFAPFRFMDLAALDRMFQSALDFEAAVVIIDHVDHIDGGRGNSYESSVASVKRLLTLAQDSELRVIAATQTNLSGAGNDPLRFHRPVRREHVKNGNHKLEVADWALGLYRPLRKDLDRGTLQDWRDGQVDLAAILERGTSELNIMKHRAYGDREGDRIRLGFAKGEVLDEPAASPPAPPPRWWDR